MWKGDPARDHRVDDVVVLAAYNGVQGRPAEKPFRPYYYAGFGLVMWEGIDTDHHDCVPRQVHKPGDRPITMREPDSAWKTSDPDNLWSG